VDMKVKRKELAVVKSKIGKTQHMIA